MSFKWTNSDECKELLVNISTYTHVAMHWMCPSLLEGLTTSDIIIMWSVNVIVSYINGFMIL